MKRHSLIITGLLIIALAFGINSVLASTQPAPVAQASPLHPTFSLLDANGENVLTTGDAVSTMQTCGQCHDTEFIAQHAFHSDLGLSDYNTSTETWNSSTGTFGQWNPLTYRYLSQSGDERLDLSTAEWLKLYGERVVGGGPATISRDGKSLTNISASRSNPETAILSENGNAEVWDWSQSGTMEMNCFLCHLEKPNNEARLKTIQSGEFNWANTATLVNTGVVEINSLGTNNYYFKPEAFDANGELKSDFVKIQDPTNQNCAQCHDAVHLDFDVPLVLESCNWEMATTGQVISPQRISDSGMNIAAKASAMRSWDIHAERQLKCTDCHYAPNNPSHALEAQGANPAHLVYDPRTLEIGEYLQKPDHNFARGQSAQYNVAPEFKGTMRRCENCHDANKSHADWLPYIDTHMNVVACETCHIPKMFAPAIQTYDWTVIKTDTAPATVCRGIEQETSVKVASTGDIPMTVTHLVTGYEPALMNRTNIDGKQLLAPYNLITSFYWVYDNANGNKRPVRLIDLESAYLENGGYAADILTAFDADADGRLGQKELVIDSSAKEEAVRTRLSALGLNNPHIEGMVQPYSINHNVTRGEDAVNDCRACHNDDSRMTQPIKLADYAPIMPVFDADNNVNGTGEIVRSEDGVLYYQPRPAKDDMYIFGNSRVKWIDWFGALLFVGVLVSVSGHGTLRFLSSRKQAKGHARSERVYMYQSYERFWHWLQTLGIVILLFTGLIIHRPDIFGAFSFRGVVTVHNVLAALLAINAFLSLFYHVTTGEIRQFIPRPRGFFDDAIEQAKYYMRGIFKGEGHPFAKTPDKKMNPLQQATYFGILNVLLPLQGLTGILMWGVQRWPQFADALGGLPFLAPFHTLIAWTFASFIVAHVYLTTTAGAKPLDSIQAMITGYEDVEVQGEN